MREIRTEIQINANADRVWEVLSDFESFPDWNPFIHRAAGEMKEGAQLDLYLQPSGGRGLAVKPRVLKADPGREFRWLGRLFIPGLFDGEHYFIIEPLQEGRVRFVHGERFRGILVPFFGGVLKNTERGFGEMNQALKERAEQQTQRS